jgi:shikimate dehydrogenase
MRKTLHFIGVSTAGSSIMRLWPHWAGALGIQADIEGRDIPLQAAPEAHRAAVGEILARDEVLGALVTTHKVSMYREARDLFAALDRLAHLCREVSCISKRPHGLVGHAKDPITAGRAMEEMLGPGHWANSQGWVLCFGAGGAGTAITVRLLTETPPPAHILVSDVDANRVKALKEIHEQVGRATDVDYFVVASAGDNTALLHSLPRGSLVVNATGMGKDTPGSPVSEQARWPEGAVAWDLNYRGELAFLAQARRQSAQLGVAAHDGWRYFLHGWAAVIAEVFGLDLGPERLRELARVAEPFRPEKG